MSTQGPNISASAKLVSIPNPRNIIQDLVKASPEHRASLMGDISQLRNISSLIRELWADEAMSADDIAERLAAFPNIGHILSQPQYLKQIVLSASQNEPGLYDCAHPDITHEHYHENIFILQKVLAVYELLDQYLKPSDEFADVYGHIKLDLMDKHINLFQHYSRFGLKSGYDAEYREARISLFEREKHIVATAEIYEQNKSILDAALSDGAGSTNPLLKKMQLYLWSMHFGAMQAYYANILLAHNLKDEKRLNENSTKFEAVSQYLGKNIEGICKHANKDVTGCIKELIQYKSHIARISSREISPTPLELNIKNMFDLLESKLLTDGLDRDTYEHKEGAIPTLNDIVTQIKILERHIESKKALEKIEDIFGQHLEMALVVYHQSDDQRVALAMTTLMRTWIKWLVSQMSQVSIKYIELDYEAIYLINRSLISKLSFEVSEEFIGQVTDSLDGLESALRLKDFSADSLVAWIEGEDAGASASRRKKTKKTSEKTSEKKSEESTSQLQGEVKSTLDSKPHPKAPSQVKDAKCEVGSSGTQEDNTEDTLSREFQALAIVLPKEAAQEQGWTLVSKNKKNKKNKKKKNQKGKRKQRNQKNHRNHPAAKEKTHALITQNRVSRSVEEKSLKSSTPTKILQSTKVTPEGKAVVIEPEVLVSTAGLTVVGVETQYPVVGQLPFSLPIEAQGIMARLNQSGKQSYIYGGYVRDNVLQKPYNDIDLVADCDEDTFKLLFPNAKKEQGLVDKIVYNISATVSVTLESGLDLEAFSSTRYLAANALFANSQGEILDPLGVMALAVAPELKPIPGHNIIAAYKSDPSRMLRTIRYSTHIQRMWDIEIHQALSVCGHMLNRLPFGKFLSHLGEMFLRGSGETHLHVLLNLGMLPNISLPLGADWAKYIDEKSISFQFMQHELAQIDKYRVKQRTIQNRLYLLTLFLLPALEKIRLIDDGTEGVYSTSNLKSSIDKVLEQFFLLYDGDIEAVDQKVRQRQIFALLEQVIWPKFVDYRHYYIQQNYYLAAMSMPPRNFYEPMGEDVVDGALSVPVSANVMLQYGAYIEGGTTYFPPSPASKKSSSNNTGSNRI
tara:strand:+ start:62095 stop:65331 length:3237 start_codon:yes stop_codon:yes gene_type:complete